MNSKNNALLIKVSGDFDLVSANDFRERIDRSLDETLCQNLLMDLSRITFIDSSGLGVILGRYRKLKAINGKMIIYGVKPSIREILEVSGVLSIITECGSEEEAWRILEPKTVNGA
jgi:stage II sporulation protein AA (anti-sigma F factor antagonist)